MYSQYIILPRSRAYSSVFSVKPEPITTLWYFLHSIPDSRRAQGKRHDLPTILLLAILALCCGSNSYQAMSEWSQNYQSLLLEQLPFLAGHIPDGATFHRVFSKLAVSVFEEILGDWLQQIVPREKGEGIALDGKTISGTGIHIVAAFTHQLQSVLFEMGTDTKGKELVTGPKVIKKIPLKGHILTGDAMFAQKKICRQIIKEKGGYVFTVKGNQGKLEQDILLYFTDLPFKANIQKYTDITRWKGRIEKRTLLMSSELNDYVVWPGLTHVWQCIREIKRNGRITTEVAVGIASLPKEYQTAEKLNKYIRGHWSIENSLHRTRDVSFHEDKATIRKGSAPQVMAALKNLVISLLHRATVRSFPAVFRRFAAKPEELFHYLGLPEVKKSYVYA